MIKLINDYQLTINSHLLMLKINMNGKIDSSKTNLIYILCQRGGNHLITQVNQTIQRLMKFEKYFCISSPPLAKILDTPLVP